jgi:hypothetical protein
MPRYFTVEFPEKGGRYSGSTPKQAACKAFTQLRKNRNGKFKFSIRETTETSSHKTYNYEGNRLKLKPNEYKEYTIGKGDKAVSIVHKHKDQIYRVN